TRTKDRGWSLQPPGSKEVWRIQDGKAEEIIREIQEARKNEESDLAKGATADDIIAGTVKDAAPTRKVVLKESAAKEYTLYLGPESDVNVFVVSSERPRRVAAVRASALSTILAKDINDLRAKDLLKIDSKNGQAVTLVKNEEDGTKKLQLQR